MFHLFLIVCLSTHAQCFQLSTTSRKKEDVFSVFPKRESFFAMENTTNSPTVQIAVTQPQQITLQSAPTNASHIQIFAQDPNNAGKALYIIDPNQAGGVQMISNSDQRFEFANSAGTQNLAGASQQQSTVMVCS